MFYISFGVTSSSKVFKKLRINQESLPDMILEVVVPTVDSDRNCMDCDHNLYNCDDTDIDRIEYYDPMNSAFAPHTFENCNPITVGKHPTLTKPYHPLAKPPAGTSSDADKSANRFTDAQRHRTLRHHRLPQPTPSQERAHLAGLRRINSHKMSSSFCSMLTLPEEESDQEEVVHLDLKQMHQSIETDATIAQRKHSITSIDSEWSSNKMNTQSRSCSDRSLSSVSIDEDSFSDASPTTTLFVPGQDVSTNKDVISKSISADVLPDANLITTLNLSSPYCQPCEIERHSSTHRFVVCADTQFGITKNNESWQAEMEYSVGAVNLINAMEPRPAFVCVCGDLGEIATP